MRRTCSRRPRHLLQCRLLEVVHEEPETAGSLQLPRYKVEECYYCSNGCQSSVHAGEDTGVETWIPGSTTTTWARSWRRRGYTSSPRRGRGGPPRRK